MNEIYDTIGKGYAVRRRPDPRIYRRLRRHLQSASSVLNVGAGAGSYEPSDLSVVAVEPSVEMISQRRDRSNVVRAIAEALPFGDAAFDAVMAVLTIHHWKDQRKGLAECGRVARKVISILTWDPQSEGFWLVRDYFPEILAFDQTLFLSMDEIQSVVGRALVETIPVPADCTDGFLGAYWRRPSAYLDASVRSGISSFARFSDVRPRIDALRKDLASGAWERRHGHLLSGDSLDIGYRLVTAVLK